MKDLRDEKDFDDTRCKNASATNKLLRGLHPWTRISLSNIHTKITTQMFQDVRDLHVVIFNEYGK
jgi:hypothetical protein